MENNVKKRSKRESRGIDEQIYRGEVLFGNYNKDEEILETCKQLGYTDDKIAVGVGLLDDLKKKVLIQENKHASQVGATSKLQEAIEIANERYIYNLEAARICFKDNDDAINLLKLNGRRKYKFSKRISEVESFYKNILNDKFFVEISKFGITKEELLADKLLFDDVIALDLEQEKLKGEAKDATHDKDEAYVAYYNWVYEFRSWLKLRLKDRPGTLKKIYK